MSQDPKALVEGLYDAFSEGDMETVIGALDEQVKWTEARGFPTGGTYVGPKQVLNEVFGTLTEAVPDFTALPDILVAEGNKVVAIGTYTGTHTETEESFEARFAHLWVVEDGSVVSFEQFVDSAQVQQAFPDEAPA